MIELMELKGRVEEAEKDSVGALFILSEARRQIVEGCVEAGEPTVLNEDVVVEVAGEILEKLRLGPAEKVRMKYYLGIEKGTMNNMIVDIAFETGDYGVVL